MRLTRFICVLPCILGAAASTSQYVRHISPSSSLTRRVAVRAVAGFSPLSSLLARQCAVSCGSGCCDANLFCCPGGAGCCGTGFTCDSQGCCPVGQTCDGFKACPTDPTQIQCADGGCCPSNEECVSTNGVHSCGAATGGGGTSAAGTETSTSAQSGASSVAAQGAVNNTVSNDDPRINYVPADAWKSVNETGLCSGDTVKRSNTTGSSFSFTFTGNAIYVNTATGPDSGQYQVSLTNGASSNGGAGNGGTITQTVDGFSAKANPCAVGFSQTGLVDGIHTLNVTLTGPSPNSQSAAQNIDFNSITFTSNSGDKNGNAAAANTAPWYHALWAGASAIFWIVL